VKFFVYFFDAISGLNFSLSSFELASRFGYVKPVCSKSSWRCAMFAAFRRNFRSFSILVGSYERHCFMRVSDSLDE
jgi:hypothetical protein